MKLSHNLRPIHFPGISHSVLILITAFLFCGSLLIGCYPSETTVESASSTPSVPAKTLRPSKTITPSPTSTLIPTTTPPAHLQITPDSLSGIELDFWHPWSGIVARQMDTLIKEFNLNNEWGITVSIHTPGSSGELCNQVEASLDNQNSLPDIVVAPMEHLLTWQAASTNAVITLDDYVSSPVWGLSEAELADIPQIFLQQSTSEENLMGLPAQRTVEVLFYNQSWAMELGFNDPPENPEEFKVQACAAAQILNEDEHHDNNGLGGWIISTDPNVTLSWLYAFGAADLPKVETQPYEINTPIGNETFSYLRDLYDEGCAWVSRDSIPYEYFSNRQALFYSGTLQDLPIQERTQARLKIYDQWTVMPYPAQVEKPVVLVHGPSYAILHSTYEEQLASWLFIRWLNQPLNQTRLVQVSNTLALGAVSAEMMEVYAGHHSQWKESLFWTPMGRPAPQLASWRTARNILGDASWQIYQTTITSENIPGILQQLDDMIIEVLSYSD